MFEEDDLSGIETSLLGIQSDDDEQIGKALLKAGVQPTAAAKAAFRKHGQKKAVQVATGNLLTKTQRVALAKVDDLPAEQRAAALKGRLQFINADYYIRKQVTGTTELLAASTVEKKGESRWQNNQISEKDTTLYIDRIDVAYGTATTTVTAPGAVKYGIDAAVVPAGILNGELVVKIDEKTVLRCRMSRFFGEPAGTTQMSSRERHAPGIMLDSPKLIKPDTKVEINFFPADGVALPNTVNHFLEASLMGQMTATRTTT